MLDRDENVDLREILWAALGDKEAQEYLGALNLEPMRARRWPARIEGIDNDVAMEGFYGLSVVCGGTKLGKSVVAYQSALTAAMNGWRVVYIDAELDDFQACQRIQNATGKTVREWLAANPTFVWRSVFMPLTLRGLVGGIARLIEDFDGKVLIVLDSINRIATKIENPKKRVSYFDALHSLTSWLLAVRRLSWGRIGVLVTSEKNRRGGTKGEALEYACDVLLKIKGKPSDAWAELNVELSREGGGGNLGKYVRNWKACRFMRPEHRDVEPPVRRGPEHDSMSGRDDELL